MDKARDIISTTAHLVNTRVAEGARPFTDAELLGFVQLAMRDIVMRLTERGVRKLKLESTQTVPALTLSLSDDAGTLPPGLVEIVKMWERTAGTITWLPMTQASENLPLNAVQGLRLNWWEFRNNIIYFIGATSITDVKIQYWCRLDDLQMPDDVVGAPDLINAIAYAAANLAHGGQHQFYEQQSQRAMQSVANLNAHAHQSRPFRRRGMRRSITIGRWR